MKNHMKDINSVESYKNLIVAIMENNLQGFLDIIDKPLLINFNTEEIDLSGGFDMMQYAVATYLAILFKNQAMFKMLCTKMKLFMCIHSYKIVNLYMFLESFIALTCENGAKTFDENLEEKCPLTSQIELGQISDLLIDKAFKITR
ncbi:hypothetical protein NOVO_08520 [Rickettsiales bacterium Ac37b]|nr:hypothetical protein NOVO_08520 [Rickettsiales bacterium Ac37b]